MERTPATSHESAALETRGEIIVLNGKHKGVRRPLKTPLTFIGSAEGCDIRLNAPTIAEKHALVVIGPDNVLFRHLDAHHESLVNGKRASHVQLQDGDTLMIGPFQFQVRLKETAHETAHGESDWDALRVQAAAVAAQQAALGEEEFRIDERHSSLVQQEEQLAAHLEEKRRQLNQLHEKTQAERKALEQDRAAYEKYVENVAGNLTEGQRELMEGQKQLQIERERLLRQQKNLQKHWKRRFAKNEQQLALRIEEVANDAGNLRHESKHLEHERAKLQYHRCSFFGQYELGRRQLHDAWEQLREAQRQWRNRRSRERALLKLKQSDLVHLEQELAVTRQNLKRESERLARQRFFMEQELEGLNQRIENRREILSQLERNGEHAGGTDAQPNSDDGSQETENAAAVNLQELDALASELADQRLQLAEQWERFTQAKAQWETERATTIAELEKTANELHSKETLLDERAHGQQQIEHNLRHRHEELNRLQQNLIGWRARLHAQQSAFDGERTRLLSEMQEREAAVKDNLSELNDFRRKWTKRTQQELDQLRVRREEFEEKRQACHRLREEWNKQLAHLQNEKRDLAEKTLALEQYRHETILKGHNSPAIERRLDRLRRRWVTQNAETVREIADARQSLTEDLARLNEGTEKLHKRSEALERKNAECVEREMKWEQQQVIRQSKQTEMEEEVRIWKHKNEIAEQQLRQCRQEFEQLARTLMDEPEMPEIASKAA